MISSNRILSSLSTSSTIFTSLAIHTFLILTNIFLDTDILLNSYFISFNSLLGSLKKSGQFLEEAKKIEEKLVAQAKQHLHTDFEFAKLLSHCKIEDKELQEAIEKNLDDIIASRQSHGLWEHKTDWGTTKYPEADSASLKWIGAETVNIVALLLHYGRIEK